MADENGSQNLSKNPDPQEKPVSGEDITPSQYQQPLPDRLPRSLIEWLARTNFRWWMPSSCSIVSGCPKAAALMGSRHHLAWQNESKIAQPFSSNPNQQSEI
jgi:hypothetical protein